MEEEQVIQESKGHKRKFVDYDGQLNEDGILSDEDFKRIKELKASKNAELALAKHRLLKKSTEAKSSGFKIPSSEELRLKRVDPSKLESNINKKMKKEERLALVKEGREDRAKFKARTAMKHNKPGGESNKQKEHRKAMPLAAKRAKVARSRQEKKRQRRGSAKQFRGKKAWK